MHNYTDEFLAKQTESIEYHTKKVSAQLDTYIYIYPTLPKLFDKNLIKLGINFHDYGKANTKFQIKVGNVLVDTLEDVEEVHHGYLSPAFISKNILNGLNLADRLILVQAIYYHHTRQILNNFKDLKLVLTKDIPNLIPGIELDYSYLKLVQNKINTLDYPEDIVNKFLITKGILNKMDYAASGNFIVENPILPLEDNINEFINGLGKFNKLQEYMYNNKEHNLVVIAPTGMGKTVAAFRWLDGSKGFFTLPLQISLNSIYNTCGKDYKLDIEKIGLLHGNTNNLFEGDKNYIQQCKNISFNLTLTTLDQLLPIVFKYPGYEVIAATLAHAKIVIDEIQAYTPELLAYIVKFLKVVTSLGGKFSIITATLPPIFTYFLEKELKIKVQPKLFLTDNIRHVASSFNKELEYTDIIKTYKDNKVLVIANTVKKAKELFNLIQVNTNIPVYLLHSNFTKIDRKIKEDAIQNFNGPGIWISTQIVEASVDIDFDILHTELSCISGLMQRMGRCYRSRTYTKNNSNVFIYIKSSGIRSVGFSIVNWDIFKRSRDKVKDFNNTVLTEKYKQEIINYTYSVEGIKGLEYFNIIKNTLTLVNNIEDYSISKKNINIRNISNINVIPDSLEPIENNIISLNTVYKSRLEIVKYIDTLESYIVKNKYNNQIGLEL